MLYLTSANTFTSKFLIFWFRLLGAVGFMHRVGQGIVIINYNICNLNEVVALVSPVDTPHTLN